MAGKHKAAWSTEDKRPRRKRKNTLGVHVDGPQAIDMHALDSYLDALDNDVILRAVSKHITDAVNRLGVHLRKGLSSHQCSDARDWFRFQWTRFVSALLRSWFACGLAVVGFVDVDHPLFKKRPLVMDLRLLQLYVEVDARGPAHWIVTDREELQIGTPKPMPDVYVFTESDHVLHATTLTLHSRVSVVIHELVKLRQLERAHLVASLARTKPQIVLQRPPEHDLLGDGADGAMGAPGLRQHAPEDLKEQDTRLRRLEQAASRLVARELKLTTALGAGRALQAMDMMEAMPTFDELDPGRVVTEVPRPDAPPDLLAFSARAEEVVCNEFGIPRAMLSTSFSGMGGGASSRSTGAAQNLRHVLRNTIAALKGNIVPVLRKVYFLMYKDDIMAHKGPRVTLDIQMPDLPTPEEIMMLQQAGYLKPECAIRQMASRMGIDPEEFHSTVRPPPPPPPAPQPATKPPSTLTAAEQIVGERT